jgi:cell division initiation protein
MIESEDFEEKGNYEIKEENIYKEKIVKEVSEEKVDKRISEEKTGKLEGFTVEKDSKIEEAEDEQRYQ